MNKEDQLDIAICSGNFEQCKKLITNKVDIEMFESNRIYPLCIACENDNYEMVHLLIQVIKFHIYYFLSYKKKQLKN